MNKVFSKLKQAYSEGRRLGDAIVVGRQHSTFLIVTTITSSVAFLTLGLLVSGSSYADSVNTVVSTWFVEHRAYWLDPIVVIYTMMGDTPFQVCLYTTAVIALLPQRREAIHLALAGIVVSLSVTVIKDILEMARPLMVVVPPPSPSFPSGHSAGIATLVGFLAIYFYRQSACRLTIGQWAFFLFFIVSMAMTRLYLGVHWLTDVVGGICLGLALACLSWLVFDSYAVSHQRKHLLIHFATIVVAVTLLVYGLINYSGDLTSYQRAG